MAKLTKRDREDLRTALRNAERAKAYLFDERTAVCRRDDMATTTLHYARKDGKALIETERAYGSDLVGLETAIATLGHFLATH